MRNFIHNLFALVMGSLILFASCTSAFAARGVEDIGRFPQRMDAYLTAAPDRPIVPYDEQLVYAGEYRTRFFMPWTEADLAYLDISVDKLASFGNAFAKKTYFTGDGKPFPPKLMASLIEDGTVSVRLPLRSAICVADADARLLPANTPLYGSAASAVGARGLLKADELQNSAIKPGDPLAVIAESRGGKWLFAATGSFIGWVEREKAAFVDEDFKDRYMYASYSVFVKDNVRASIEGRNILIKMGAIFPLDGDSVLVPARDPDGTARLVRYKPRPGDTAPFPLPFTYKLAARAVGEMLGEPYGWGGSGGARDCSAATKDYFAVFGVWLPRNSGEQAKTGVSVPLRGQSPDSKIRIITESGVPFATLIHMSGHIMLYIGVYNGEPVIAHNAWGVRVNTPDGKAGRAVIGKMAVTSLRPGREIKNRPKSSLLIDNISSLVYPIGGVR
ncbi:hydrolase Nlp/P60 [Synergistales bacterium]|nr:hydrolase Nlp/P60 [Synergistales bacterium]